MPLHENGENPYHPETAHKADGDGHGHKGIAHAPQRAHHHAHQAAHALEHAADGHALHAKGDNFRVGGIDSKQLVAQQIGARTQRQPHAQHQRGAQGQNTVDPFCLAGAHVLAGKAQGCLGEGVLGGGDKALDVGGSSVPRHGQGAKGIDGGLDEHVGDGERAALNARRQANLHHAQQLVLL